MNRDASVSEEKEKRVIWLRCCGGAVQSGYEELLADKRWRATIIWLKWRSGGGAEDVGNIMHFKCVEIKCDDLW